MKKCEAGGEGQQLEGTNTERETERQKDRETERESLNLRGYVHLRGEYVSHGGKQGVILSE